MPAHLLPRFGLLFVGIVLLSFAISLSIRSDIGTSPISSVPYVYSIITDYSVGTLTIVMQIFMIMLQILILGKNFQWFQWVQLPISLVFGLAIDSMLWLTQGLHPETYFVQLALCLSGCLLTAIAVCLMIKANLIMMAVDAVYFAIMQRWGFNFGRCKMWGDLILVAFAVISIWLSVGNLIGIGEGTLLGALLVGSIIRKILPYFDWIDFSTSDETIISKPNPTEKTA